MNTQFSHYISDPDYPLIIAAIGLLILMFLAANLFLLVKHLKRQHEWNRRKEAQDLIGQMIKGELYETRKILEKYANFEDPHENYLTAVNRDNKEALDFNLKVYLSFFEGVALGVKHNIYDNDIVFDYLGARLSDVYRWSKSYIDHLREDMEDPTAFHDVEQLAEKWGQRNRYHKMKVIKDLQMKGKNHS